jgi:uncharacterized protein (TIGR02246 family)
MTTTTSIEEEILSLEKSYWEALKNKDAKKVTELTADTCLVVGAEGVRELSGREVAEMMKSMPYELKDYGVEAGDVKFVSAANDVAMLAYKVRSDFVSEGKPSRMEAFDTSVWVKRNGRWTCALHTETPAASKPPHGKVS